MTTALPSIRRTLLVRLLGPLLLLTLLAGAAAYAVARHYSDALLDQRLYDFAIALANRIDWKDGVGAVALPAGALPIAERDVGILYEVIAENGDRIAGNAELAPAPRPLGSPGAKQSYRATIGGDTIRLLSVRLGTEGGGPVVVRIGETGGLRTMLASQLLWISISISLAMAAATAALVWWGIGRGIASLQLAVRQTANAHVDAQLAPIPLAPDAPEEVRPLIAQINALIARLAEAHRLNERFIVNAAHQMRTPVATLRVQLESAQRAQDPERRAEALQDALQAVRAMTRMLHQMLTLARTDDSNAQVPTSATADIVQLARDELERRLDDADALGVDLGYDGPATRVQVAADDALVREALANLLDNALRYGRSGGPVTVGVIASRTPELYVEDHGPGIPAAERERATDRFYRLPGTRGDGCGLGLAIVKEIAHRCGAKLVLDRASGESGLRARLVFAQTSGATPREATASAR